VIIRSIGETLRGIHFSGWKNEGILHIFDQIKVSRVPL